MWSGLLVADAGTEPVGFGGVTALPVSVLWHLFPVRIWTNVDVAGSEVAQRTLTWLITVGIVTAALWFVPVRRPARPAAYR